MVLFRTKPSVQALPIHAEPPPLPAQPSSVELKGLERSRFWLRSHPGRSLDARVRRPNGNSVTMEGATVDDHGCSLDRQAIA